MSIEGDDFDLEADLNAALDAGKPQEEITEAPEGETAAEEQARYVREGRRFVKEQKEEPVAAKEGEAKPETKAEPAPKENPPLWFKNEWGEWEKLNPDMRKALAQREKDYAQGIEKHSTAAKAWEPVNKLLEPHLQELRASGVEPQQYVSNLIEADKYLRADPVQALNWLCQSYTGTDLQGVVDWMAQNGVQANKPDPVQQELAAMKQKLAALESAPQRQQQETINRTISEWSKDKPDYPELERTIVGLIQADPSVREQFRVDPRATLDALYERAQWTHPTIRDRILKDREDQRVAELKRARAAGAQSPRGGSNSQVAQSYKTMTLEEEIAANLG